MNLSNRLTFSLIFSVVLVALFAFTVAPAMAQVEVTAEATETVTNVDTAGSVVRGKRVVTITYSQDAWPAPTKADITTDGTTALAEDVAFAKVNNKTFTLTFLGSEDGTSDANISAIKLSGYEAISTADLNADAAELVADPVTDPEPREFQVSSDHLGGGSYLVITNNNTAIDNTSVFPTLPVVDPEIVKRAWFDHDGDADTTDGTGDGAMPDLYSLFQVNGGGTLNLSVVYDHDADGNTPMVRFGSVTGDPAAPDATHNRNARYVVMNEVMWAYDNQHVGAAARTQEQYIELLNRSTTPFPYANIILTTSKTFPAPPAETDRFSNIPSFTNTWNITGKGQHGNSGAEGVDKVEFIAMHRTNHGDGWNAGHWAAAGDYFLPNYKGTPGAANSTSGVQGTRTAPGTDTPAKGTFVINEIGNMSDNANDWIEIKNISGSAQSLKEWTLTIVTAFNNEAEIYRFPDKSIPAGGVFLLVNKDPKNSNLARGFNLNVAAVDQDFGSDSNISYLIVGSNKLAIPNDNNWLLILRNGKPWDKNVFNSGFKVQDVAGAARIVVQDLNAASPRKEKKSDGAAGGDIWQTTHFPLNGQNLGGDKILAHNRNLEANVWARNTGKQGYQVEAFNSAGFTGIGYDRNVANSAANGGTPGYDNGIAKGKVGDISDGTLVISEIMLTTDNNRYPQWVELQNTSKTQGIHLAADGSDPKTGWQILIENHNSGTWQSKDRPLHVTINLRDWFSYIPPNQSVLIAAFTGSYSANLPDNRVADVTGTKRGEFKMDGRRDSFLNAEGGFYIRIVDGDGNVVDAIGNLDGDKADTRAGIGIDAAYGWDWPADMTDDDERTSLIRIRNDDGSARAATPVRPVDAVEDDPATADTDESKPAVEADESRGAVLPMGTDIRGKGMVAMGMDADGNVIMVPGKFAGHAWVHASDSDRVDVPRSQETWFGSPSDIGTPLHTAGKPLPVSLSFFRPTLEDGKVVIRWTTESELDNAGFNILRSEDRNGEFTKVNEQLIQGKGTTAERSTYKWVDSSAKPGAIYYYQIEDVSFAGERNTLTTTKLKGLISAKNKLTTRWGELKSQN